MHANHNGSFWDLLAKVGWGPWIILAALVLIAVFVPNGRVISLLLLLGLTLYVVRRSNSSLPTARHEVELAHGPARAAPSPDETAGSSAASSAPPAGEAITLRCLICGNSEFSSRYVQLNTALLTFFGLDWANRSARCEICTRCGHVHWFHEWPNQAGIVLQERIPQGPSQTRGAGQGR